MREVRSTAGLGVVGSLKRTAIKVTHWERRKLNAFKAPNIDYYQRIFRLARTFGKQMNAALGAEPMLDSSFAERIDTDFSVGREQTEVISWNTPKERPFL
jgi:hypothetical protein